MNGYPRFGWVDIIRFVHPIRSSEEEVSEARFVPLAFTADPTPTMEWSVEHLVLRSPKDEVIEIKSTSLFVVAELLRKMS